MHELSVCQALLAQVEQVARENAAHSVEKVVLRIGPLSGVEPRLLQDAFPIARAGTVAAGAELVIEELPLTSSSASAMGPARVKLRVPPSRYSTASRAG